MQGGNNFYKVEKKGADIQLIPKGEHTHTLVFMHGLGDTAQGYLDFFTGNKSPTPQSMKIVLLTAPTRSVTINLGMQMPSWFDFREFTVDESNFEQAIGVEEANESANRISQIVTKEIEVLKGDSKKVFIGGFSQGASMSLKVGLTHDNPLGGILAFSGFLFPKTVESDANKNILILISHGMQDALLPWVMCDKSYRKLDKTTHRVRFELINNLAHSFNDRSLVVFKEFLSQNK